MHWYSEFKEALKADIKEAWALDTHFGKPTQTIKTPHAVVRTTIEREHGVRYVHELYTFEIIGFFKITTGSVEEQLMEKANALVQKLNPYTLDQNALPDQGYAGGFQNKVTEISMYDRSEEVDLTAVVLTFKVYGLVYN